MPNAAQLPPDLARVVTELQAADRQATELVDGLDEAGLNWQPDGGAGWSIAQCLEHLRVTCDAYVQAMRPAVAEARARGRTGARPLRPSWPVRRFIATLSPRARLKVSAPAALQPPSRLPAEAVLGPYLATHDALRSLVHVAADLDLNRVLFRNPFLRFVPLSVGSGLLVVVAHETRHLAQARRVRESPELPFPDLC